MEISKNLSDAIADMEDAVFYRQPPGAIRSAYQKVIRARCDELTTQQEAILRAIWNTASQHLDGVMWFAQISEVVGFEVLVVDAKYLSDHGYISLILSATSGDPCAAYLTPRGERLALHYERRVSC